MNQSKSGVSGKGSKSQSPKANQVKPGISKSKSKAASKKDFEEFCESEISIPSDLPGILKAYTKGAIRTQPANLLIWSIAYFRCMENGVPPPVKEKIEAGSAAAEGKLTVGFLQVLHKQLGSKQTVTYEELEKKWKGICQDEKQLSFLFASNKIDKKNALQWKRILPLLTTLIGKDMNEYMTMICKVFSTRKRSVMNWEEFWELYTNLAQTLKKGTNDAVKEYLQPLAEANSGLIGPQDFNDPRCPRF